MDFISPPGAQSSAFSRACSARHSTGRTATPTKKCKRNKDTAWSHLSLTLTHNMSCYAKSAEKPTDKTRLDETWYISLFSV